MTCDCPAGIISLNHAADSRANEIGIDGRCLVGDDVAMKRILHIPRPGRALEETLL